MIPLIPIQPIRIPPIHINVPDVPFYSQFIDITRHEWQKVGCGVTSLAMIINYYKPGATSVNDLLTKGIAGGAYDQNAGWIYNGLITLAEKYGLKGTTYDFAQSTNVAAFAQFKKIATTGPVIVSVHYKFDPKSTIPHLVVIDSIDDNIVYYNDPASKVGKKQISVDDFMRGWKKRFIVIRPV